MKLGWKLFFLLLGFSLVPFVALRLNAVRGMERLGEELSGHVTTFLVREATGRMADLVEDHARLLQAKRDNLALLLRLQAGEVQKRLLGPAPDSAAGSPFLIRLRNPGQPRHDGSADSGYRLLGPDGVLSPAVLTDAPLLFTAPPGVSLRALRPEMARLRPLADDVAHPGRPDGPPLWRVVALANGLTAVTTTEGRHPGLFDPRDSFWYRSAMAAGPTDDPVWTLPYMAPALERIVLTVALAMRDASGETLGVTAITTPLDDLLAELTPGGHISHELASFLVTAVTPADAREGERQLLAAAGSRPGRGRHGWLTRVEPEHVRSENQEIFTEVARDVAEGRAGVRRLSFEGRDSLWAYAPAGPGQALLQIAPVAEVLAEASAAASYVERRIAEQVAFSGIVAAAVMLVLFPATLLGARTVTRPAADLARAARRLATGDFTARAHPKGHDELAELGRIFNAMAPQLADRVRMRESLELAMEVQLRLLPKAPPRLAALDMAALSIYCDETGGDYYDFFEFTGAKKGRVGMVVGDVCGHGVGAALLMATARALVRPRAALDATPGTVVAGVNRDLCLDTMGTGRFMTLYYVEIDPAGRSLRWARAGHDPAMLYDPGTGSFTELGGRGMPLGVLDDAAYQDMQLEAVPAGAVLVVGSDGIWESRNADGEMFGKTRLEHVVRQTAERGAAAVVAAVAQALDDFRGDAPQEDDVTLVVVAFTS
ncbi:SpoIIE family protein phosphatase [Desulfovibrio sulfodismutans]|uniref:SpoIIE family protein phosphatase n=1 Tax=Desulfolutivibrio sulfodismutans TaxID=63561 RepID=A0A7K3NKS5_9BACT|nr:SpoIIE family protein phosphatase [Desulfolutivibrio sulfodismutans]NDY56365.1 SpoIIE family protein phosphatase [Desulfolutivibrio sulfodismutans]QLA13463.1 SpoIIE family protein phosphatase [Desulfolutivibrio sulfodismutans DSM 3696]